MHATSGSCRSNPERRLDGGFTLLELVVVMALGALMVGVVVPAAQRGLAAAEERGMASDMGALLDSLPVRAFQRGETLVADERFLRGLLPGLPEDWRIVVPQPLRYGPTGVASGGEVRLLPSGRLPLAWTVQALNGTARRVDKAGER
jgi:prepilin-type N-terminal cleavage/methylation domain-containing protein